MLYALVFILLICDEYVLQQGRVDQQKPRVLFLVKRSSALNAGPDLGNYDLILAVCPMLSPRERGRHDVVGLLRYAPYVEFGRGMEHRQILGSKMIHRLSIEH